MSERFPELYPSGKREWKFLGAGAVVVALSIILDYMGVMCPTSWFQRSGSILVALGAVCEAKYVAKIISPNVVATGKDLTFKQKFSMHSGFIMAIFGTVVWGYGDLVSHA